MQGPIDPESIYTKQTCIGGGSFGKVYKGVDRRTGESVAIKIIDVENAEDDVDDIIKEIAILSELKSPYVTKYHGSYLKGSNLWIIMEFCSGGSCHGLLRPGVIHEEYIAIIIRELLRGLDYLHGDQKLHRDIKAANILLSASGQVKLADFGVSGQLSATMTKKNTFVGTPFWMAPEVIKQSGYDYKADIWSLGITAIELACGDPPYADIHPMKVLFLIPKNPPPTLHGEFSKSFKQFVELCLRRDPKERPSAKELLEHPFVKRAKRTTYLTELIERAERWQATHRGHSEDGDEFEELDHDEQFQEQPEEHEDLWDFGTVRPAGKGLSSAPVLSPLNESATNSRVQEAEEWDLQDDNPRLAQPSTSTPRQSSLSDPDQNISPSKTTHTPSGPLSPVKQTASPHLFGSPLRKPPATNTINPFENSPTRVPKDRASQAAMGRPNGPVPGAAQGPSSSPAEHKSSQPEQATSNVSDKVLSPSGEVNRKLPPSQRPLPDLNTSPLRYEAPLQPPSTPGAKPTSGLKSKLGPRAEDRAGGHHTPGNSPRVGDQARQAHTPQHRTQAEIDRATSCGAIVIPSLRAAMNRRACYLSRLEPGRHGENTSPGGIKRWEHGLRVHRNMEHVADELARSFAALHRLDMEDPIPMTGGIDAVLDVFLEEVLVRMAPKRPSNS
ncbi:hypothetical protein N7492_003723 [Penicillium capsulatum]|uniref:non-specific serine/threonine protein kinase n=1 Tax=Penicillium capsulatum TaxID=69766 RepID=A0A9W9ILS5_9EURO|nr:hypothetical protein N7492_003723 [Penicillium capsulatum]KAJ6121695.1 hypothetical protein N7512_004160 [Penicillium capsulatum]